MSQGKSGTENSLNIVQYLQEDSPQALFGQVGASPPSCSAGAPLYISHLAMKLFWPPGAPALRANVKPAQSRPVTWAWSELDLYMLQPSLGSGIATHDSEYPCPLPRQRSERSYHLLCH